nr:MAG TPA: hypothetical protein [Caudoviricetes sp.]
MVKDIFVSVRLLFFLDSCENGGIIHLRTTYNRQRER